MAGSHPPPRLSASRETSGSRMGVADLLLVGVAALLESADLVGEFALDGGGFVLLTFLNGLGDGALPHDLEFGDARLALAVDLGDRGALGIGQRGMLGGLRLEALHSQFVCAFHDFGVLQRGCCEEVESAPAQGASANKTAAAASCKSEPMTRAFPLAGERPPAEIAEEKQRSIGRVDREDRGDTETSNLLFWKWSAENGLS